LEKKQLISQEEKSEIKRLLFTKHQHILPVFCLFQKDGDIDDLLHSLRVAITNLKSTTTTTEEEEQKEEKDDDNDGDDDEEKEEEEEQKLESFLERLNVKRLTSLFFWKQTPLVLEETSTASSSSSSSSSSTSNRHHFITFSAVRCLVWVYFRVKKSWHDEKGILNRFVGAIEDRLWDAVVIFVLLRIGRHIRFLRPFTDFLISD